MNEEPRERSNSKDADVQRNEGAHHNEEIFPETRIVDENAALGQRNEHSAAI